MKTYNTSWSEAYMQGTLDGIAGEIDEQVIQGLAYYLQSTNVENHPNNILFIEELLLDDEHLFEIYEAYTKGVIETVSNSDFENIRSIFIQASHGMVEDYDVEVRRIDSEYNGLENLSYFTIHSKTRVIEEYLPPSFNFDLY